MQATDTVERNLMTATSLKIAIAATLLTAAGAGGAFAHERHMNMQLGNNFHHRSHVYLFVGGGGCEYYYDRWRFTGQFYWKSKYYQCKGWW